MKLSDELEERVWKLRALSTPSEEIVRTILGDIPKGKAERYKYHKTQEIIMADHLRAENLKIYEPWHHIVNSLGPLEHMPENTHKFVETMNSLTMDMIPVVTTDRGHARKFQHITNLNGSISPVELDAEAYALKDYADAGELWNLWQDVYGELVLQNYFARLRPHAFAQMQENESPGNNYGVKMTYWKDTLFATRQQTWLGLARKHTLLRFMMYVHPDKDRYCKPIITLWSGEKSKHFSYKLRPGFSITYNPTNERHLIDCTTDYETRVEDLAQDFQNTWIMFEIIKNDIED